MRHIGWWTYGGEETCGHCKYWKPPAKLRDWYWADAGEPTEEDGVIFQGRKKVWYDVKGDCKLLFGKEDKTQYETCGRFKPRFRYKHWERR